MLHEKLGRPLDRQERCKVVHVGGTNGKGSVSFKLAAALEASGLRTGLFVSPHVSSFRERAVVGGRGLEEEEVEVR